MCHFISPQARNNMMMMCPFSHEPRDVRDAAPLTHRGHPVATTTMNSLYTLGVRQSSSIQADLERLRGGDVSASLLGLSYSSHVVSFVVAHLSQGRYLLRSQG